MNAGPEWAPPVATPARWRGPTTLAARAVALVACAVLTAVALGSPPDLLGARLVLFRALVLPAAVVASPLLERSVLLAGVLVLGLVAQLVAARSSGAALVPPGVRAGTPWLVRELYCWYHALGLLPVAVLLIVSEGSRLVPPALVLLYAFHWIDSPGLGGFRAGLGGLVGAASWALFAVVALVLGSIAASQALLAVMVCVLAAVAAGSTRRGARAVWMVWAVGALLITTSDQWLYVVLAAADALVAWKLGFFDPRVVRRVRTGSLALLLLSQLLLGRGIGFLMGFRPLERLTIERQGSVHVVAPYPTWRDGSLGEHLTLAAPACGGGVIAGGVSTSRWVGGGPDAIEPQLRRLDRSGRRVARGDAVLEPAYSSILDCERRRLWIGAGMGASVSSIDADDLRVVETVDLPCRQNVLGVSWLPRHDWLSVGCGPTLFLDASSLRPVASVDLGSFDARERGDEIELASAAGATRFAVRSSADGQPRLSRKGGVTWDAFEAAETRWGPVTSQVGRLVRYDEETLAPATTRRIGVWIRYLRAHPRLPYLTASDYLRGRVYLVRLPELTVVDGWFVGERPREAWLDDEGRAIWVGSAAGVVRIDVPPLEEE